MNITAHFYGYIHTVDNDDSSTKGNRFFPFRAVPYGIMEDNILTLYDLPWVCTIFIGHIYMRCV